MLYLASELKYLSEEEYKFLLNSSKEISKIISGLIKTLH
ncbi:MAG: four helix bundle protein [Bacteroidia bacterium]|nr:four helix bundle protein [Bacteroidia bacterium]